MEIEELTSDISTEPQEGAMVVDQVENSKEMKAESPVKVDYYPPPLGEGKMLNSSGGLGEPLNVIISGKSSPEVLTDHGFLNWARSIGFSTEFLGLHRGTPQTADLGDGNGPKPEVKVIRQDYGIPFFGTGIESLIGGNHFRYWRQDGPTANSGALFLADELVLRAVGKTKYKGVKYSTTSEAVEGLLPAGAVGINHSIAIDGKVVLLTITIT
ncbi:hypothetical protein Clacol_007673 [Clathrus columnatus]|uniref:Uncharacterized protein n=1 Tax=Clathrus columnatus TaxID=1419009 RepID=A0AAV5AL44_9AGAM|nr:hypothetical protein Clacol_007673 [Clathrus columnatus]